MRHIAIIGAPTSGKTDLANELAQKIDGDVLVIDNYVKEIEQEADLVLGMEATYIGNLYVVLGRYARERHAFLEKPEAIITCGTLIESSVYATLQAVGRQSDAHWVRIANFMNSLGSFYQDTWRYTDIFHLPLGNPTPESNEERVDAATKMAIQAFGVNAVELNGDGKVERAVESFSELETAE
jgi:hypothetical protein